MKSYNFYKWRIWSILAISFVISFFHRSSLGAISGEVSEALNLTASQLSNLASITFYAYAMMQIPAGILLDRFGYKKISTWGMVTTGIGSILFGLAHHVSLAYIGRLLIGIGTSVIFISVLKVQHTWFTKKEFTKASAFLSLIGNIGALVATFPLAYLSDLIGFSPSILFMGILSLLAALAIHLFTAESPTHYGFAPKELPTEPKSTTLSLWQTLKIQLISPHTWRNFFVLFSVVGCTTTLTGLWGVRYLETMYGISTTQASFYISFVIYGFIVGSLFVNPIVKLFGDKFYLYPRVTCILNAVLWGYILFVAHGTPSLPLLALIFFCMGFLAMSHIAAFTDIRENVATHSSALVSSFVNSGEFIGSSFITLVIGSILDFTWLGQSINHVRIYDSSSYILAFSIFFAISLLGVATSFIGTRTSSTNYRK